MDLHEIRLDPAAIGLDPTEAEETVHLGRRCLRFVDTFRSPTIPGLELRDGTLEMDLVVPADRSFHGLQWHVRGDHAETFFVRPHQVGNPDSIQYTPVSHDISSWQLYHGPGFWAPVRYPIGGWFTMRVVFAGERAEAYVADLGTPALSIARLKHGAVAGAVGLIVSGPGLHVARVAWSPEPIPLVGTPEPEEPARPGVIAAWDVSDGFPEAEVAGLPELPAALVGARSWTRLPAEPSGLADLAFVNGIRDDRNTALARAVIDAPAEAVRPLELGFSDRASVFLNGRRLFRGDDTYRIRDYRFLGSIGYWYTLDVPLRAGRNELLVAVSEDFGGWGVMARFADVDGPEAGPPTR